MKKLLTVILSLCMILAVGGCGSKECDHLPIDPPVEDKTPKTVDFGSSSHDRSLFYKNANMPVLGDPFLFYDDADSTFYLYGTTRMLSGEVEENFKYYYSKDLVNWENGGVCFQPTAADWCHSRLWAPEVHKIDGKYYFYYTGASNGSAQLHGSVAVGDTPTLFTNQINSSANGSKPLFDFGFPTIDGTMFVDDDGEMYYYFAKDQVSGISTIWGIKMSDPFTTVGKAVQLTDVGKSYLGETGTTQKWELANPSARWNEGPYMIKENDTYYLTYSANYFGDKYYAVGYAMSDTPLSDFVKPDNAQILGLQAKSEKNMEWNYFSGAGHHMFLNIGTEKFVVYHRHESPNETSRRVMSIDRYGFREDGSMYIGGVTLNAQPLPAAISGYKNIASDGTVSIDSANTETLSFLNDGAISVYPRDSIYEFSANEGKTEITIKFSQKRKIRAIMFYNSATFELAADKIDKIEIDNKYLLNNIYFDLADRNNYRKFMFVGGTATASFASELDVEQIKITIQSEKDFNLSDIVVLGK